MSCASERWLRRWWSGDVLTPVVGDGTCLAALVGEGFAQKGWYTDLHYHTRLCHTTSLIAWRSPLPSTAAVPRSTSCGQHQFSIASYRTPQRFSLVDLVIGASVRITPISAATTSCHPVARKKAVLLVAKSAPLLLHVGVGGAIEASLPCYHERQNVPAPASKHPLRELIGECLVFGVD
ncbi:uncharacterized protein DS421_16g551740 [Arachis hypogaea]|nr:uncharacterized protein DS421_16g551740 [Arachis hypogaea]